MVHGVSRDRQKMISAFHEIRSISTGSPLGIRSWGCSHFDDIFLALREADPVGDKVIINAGCNKGYNFATFAALWTPDIHVTPMVWGESLKSSTIIGDMKKKSEKCGNCYDCLSGNKFKLTALADETKKPNLFMVGIDLNPVTINVIKNVSRVLGDQEKSEGWNSRVNLLLKHAAVGHKLGSIPLSPVCRRGGADEGCALVKGNSKGPKVPMVTIDSVIDEIAVQTKSEIVDILLIDTEGNDPLAINGTLKALQGQRVRLMIFEYHDIGMWQTISLKSVVELLGSMAYQCYMSGRGALFPINNGKYGGWA